MVWLPGRIEPSLATSVRAEFDGARRVELVLDVAQRDQQDPVAFAADALDVADGNEIDEIYPRR